MSTPNHSSNSDWTRVQFGDVVHQVKDKVDPKKSGLERYIAGEHMDTDDLRIRRWGQINEDYLGPAFHMRFNPGQVLYGSRRTYLRKVAVPDFEGICANTTYVLESKDPSVMLPDLLPFMMQTETFHEHSIKQSKGSVNPYINFSDIAWYEFALPPLEEQRRIAELLVAIDETIKGYSDLAELISNLQHASGIELFINFTKSNTRRLDSLALKIGSGKTPRGGRKVYTSQGVLFLRSQNIYPDGLHLEDVAYISEKIDAEMSSTRVKKDDVLLNITGASIGRCTIYNLDDSANVNQHVCIIRTKHDLMPAFLTYYLQSQVGQRQIIMRKTMGNREGLNFEQLRNFEIPIFTLQEQQNVVEKFDKLANGYHLMITRITTTKKLKNKFLMTSLKS